MNEAEWLACTNPQRMLEFLRGKASDRKMRLFLCACGMRTLADSPYEELAEAVPTVELFAEGIVRPEDFALAQDGISWGISEMCESLNLRTEALAAAIQAEPVGAAEASRVVARAIEGWKMNVPDLDVPKERLAQSNLLRDILGNPFRPTAFDPAWFAWNGGTVRKLAQAVYDERAFERLPVLADALEEAGCTNEYILGHCRQRGEHVRGCWVVDLLLGKS
jgi:hypothetical protein